MIGYKLTLRPLEQLTFFRIEKNRNSLQFVAELVENVEEIAPIADGKEVWANRSTKVIEASVLLNEALGGC